MGEIAEKLADQVFVTQDNSRSESFKSIANQILSGMSCPGLVEVTECRYTAIERAMRMSSAKDTILLAGMGHDKCQLAKRISPMSDMEIVENIITR